MIDSLVDWRVFGKGFVHFAIRKWLIIIKYISNMILRPVVAQGNRNKCGCKRDRLWVRFPLEEMKYLNFPLISRRGVEFRIPPWT